MALRHFAARIEEMLGLETHLVGVLLLGPEDDATPLRGLATE